MRVIALGGGGFSDGMDPGLDVYLLEQTGVASPRIGFIPTASGDSDSYLLKFYSRFGQLDCRPDHLALFRRTPDPMAWIQGQDVVFVGGGNTRSMLAVWREWGIREALARASETGTILSGISAGAICWFDSGLTDSSSAGLEAIDTLGMVPGSCCPHFSAEPERRPAFERCVAAGTLAPGYGLDDGAALDLRDGEPFRVVRGRPGASVHRVFRSGDGARTEAIEDVETVEVGGEDR